MEGLIVRDVAAAADRDWDVVIVGGGIYGVALALEVSRSGRSALLLERGDFGHATSWNSLRIVHGGLRYLQALDLPRFHESVQERRWFLRHFPDHVQPLACLMPLYGAGLRRPAVLRAALAANDLLSWRRNAGVRADRRLPAGRVLTTQETIEAFPAVDRRGLLGGALWHDAVMPDSQRLLMELLRWAASLGAGALNYVDVRDLVRDGERVAGVRARDRVGGREVVLRAPVVVNCGGPWAREIAAASDRDRPELFVPSLAFNLLLDHPPLASVAVAVEPRLPGARTYFVHPFKGRAFAGTFHAAWDADVLDGSGEPAARLVRRFLDDLNVAVPGLGLDERHVLRVHWGRLPARRPGSETLAVRETILDHGRRGGPRGLFSVSGVKFTTARRVAEKCVRHLPPPTRTYVRVATPGPSIEPRRVPAAADYLEQLRQNPAGARATAVTLAREEAVVRIDDLLLRRSDWGIDPATGARIERHVAPWLAADLVGLVED